MVPRTIDPQQFANIVAMALMTRGGVPASLAEKTPPEWSCWCKTCCMIREAVLPEKKGKK
jgi:hypothetical protein